MPGFAAWTQPNASSIVVGSQEGGYGSENAVEHLNYVSRELDLKFSHELNGLGSSWFGETSLMAAVARLTMEVMRWLNTQVRMQPSS